MADFPTVLGIVTGIIGLLVTAFTIYVWCTPSTALISQAEAYCDGTRDYLKKLFADGLLDYDRVAEFSSEIAAIENAILELRGESAVRRWWWSYVLFWMATFSIMRQKCAQLDAIRADIALRASATRKALRQRLGGAADPERSHVFPNWLANGDLKVLDVDAGKSSVLATNDAVLEKLECGTLASSFAVESSAVSRPRKFTFMKVNLKRYWFTVRARLGTPRTSKPAFSPSGGVEKRYNARRFTNTTLVETLDDVAEKQKGSAMSPPSRSSPLPDATPHIPFVALSSTFFPVSGDKSEIRQSYIPALFPHLVQPLMEKGASAVDDTIAFMDEYFISHDDWDTLVKLGVGAQAEAAVLKQISTATKSAFTRKYNARDHPLAFHKAEALGKPPKRLAAAGAAPDLEEAFDVEDEVSADEEKEEADEGLENDKLIKAAKGKGKGKAVAVVAKGEGKVAKK
ncbi:replication factor RFC1 C terminal domain-containing protein [Epithele typhae]|uniref:replication factor RFC1 C terminal domain-containing protein n=1 Tax=Epithele typhae TaxID=378194 RepID=UPI00200810D3|nr:replication factor RFC1 C terminal domain-containing protein [Epithele typhae]KAH9936829.1 replication factor RFC1 C terminal domain-containing protein [Epithele typhae]